MLAHGGDFLVQPAFQLTTQGANVCHRRRRGRRRWSARWPTNGRAQRPAVGLPQRAKGPQREPELFGDARHRRARVIQRARF